MEWILLLALVAVLVVIGVTILVILTSKHHGGRVSGHFAFDKYKEGELASRGLFSSSHRR